MGSCRVKEKVGKRKKRYKDDTAVDSVFNT